MIGRNGKLYLGKSLGGNQSRIQKKCPADLLSRVSGTDPSAVGKHLNSGSSDSRE